MSGVDPRISDADALVCAFYKLEFLSAIQQADKLKYCLPPQYLPLIRLNVFFFYFSPHVLFFLFADKTCRTSGQIFAMAAHREKDDQFTPDIM